MIEWRILIKIFCSAIIYTVAIIEYFIILFSIIINQLVSIF
jgi:hypothetical protein